jgi:hypothetical protein
MVDKNQKKLDFVRGSSQDCSLDIRSAMIILCPVNSFTQSTDTCKQAKSDPSDDFSLREKIDRKLNLKGLDFPR